MTKEELDELTEIAKNKNIPGPDTIEHPENYDEECYCRTCLSYGE